MKRILVVAIAVGVVGMIVAACGGGPHPLGVGDAAVILQDVNGVCSKPTSVGQVKGHKGAAVSWVIQNNCAEGTFVTLRDFTAATPGNNTKYPLDSYEAVWIDANSNKTIKGKLRDHADPDTYHFYFYLDERKQTGDPDIVIDNF